MKEVLSELAPLKLETLNLKTMKKGDRVRLPNGVTLERTFDQNAYDTDLSPNGVIEFARVVGPVGHPSLGSDLSIEGLREWGII